MTRDVAQSESPKRARQTSRFGRLCLKELRETLRDRRTIITLVLMPLIVYPILSIIFQRFLLDASSVIDQTAIVGVAREAEVEIVEQLVRSLHRNRPPPRKSNDAANKLNQDLRGVAALPEQWKVAAFTGLREKLSAGAIDLGIEISSGEQQEAFTPLRFHLLFNPDSARSRRIHDAVERHLIYISREYAEARLKQLNDSGVLPTEVESSAVVRESSTTQSLATLIPLVLVLMTITGAVYPAIDLTAGERERGTMESLVAAPVPRTGLLLAKYVAVLTVAMLTASANLLAMAVTLYSSGLGEAIFGLGALQWGTLSSVFFLMILFASFFSAVLLAVTSFARSFKEAQAYLIPLILLSLAPTLLCLAPGIELKGMLAIAPLVNIVLLARDVFTQTVNLQYLGVVVFSTAIYAASAIGIASRLFGSDAILYGSQASWSDLFKRPKEPQSAVSFSGAILFLAMLFPGYVLLAGLLSQVQPVDEAAPARTIGLRLVLSSLMTVGLFGLCPLVFAKTAHVRFRQACRLAVPRLSSVVGAAILGFSLWPLLHQLTVFSLGPAGLPATKIKAVEVLLEGLRDLPVGLVLLTIAIVPAVFEELFFRGFLFSAFLKQTTPRKTIILTAVLFGVFHVLAKYALATERFLPTTCMGFVLGWVCWRSGSIVPGMILHALHNGVLSLILYYRNQLEAAGWGVQEQAYMPVSWIAAGAVGTLVGALVIVAFRSRESSAELISNAADS